MPREGAISYPRRAWPVFLILDSAGMNELEKTKLNEAAKWFIAAVKKRAASPKADFDVKFAALKVDASVQWLTPDGMVPINSFVWNEMEPETDVLNDPEIFGRALLELESKLSSRTWLNFWRSQGGVLPNIVFMTNGENVESWEKDLTKVRENRICRRSGKYALILSDRADRSALEKLTSNSEFVVIPERAQEILQRIGWWSKMKEGEQRLNNSSPDNLIIDVVDLRQEYSKKGWDADWNVNQEEW